MLQIQQAFEELIMVTQIDRDQARYEERFKAELDARSTPKAIAETAAERGYARGYAEGYAEGLAEDRAEGFAEGRAEGVLIGRIQMFQQISHQPPTPLEELAALPLAELQQRAALLEQQLGNLPRSPGAP